MKIDMVDLKGQYRKIKSEINLAIHDVIESAAFIKGPKVKEFEQALAGHLGVKHVCSCGNGTDALQIALMALDLQPGDEIILPAFTYAATAEVVALLGLQPVMVDVDPGTFNINPALIGERITSRTRAIIPVHLFGQCADMEQLLLVAGRHGLPVIEDTAQALGSTYTFKNGDVKSAGCMGIAGTTSFFPSKNLGCYGDGGALLTNNDAFAGLSRIISNHGQTSQYVHERVGINSRLDSIQAAVLLVKLNQLAQYQEARISAARLYNSLLSGNPYFSTPARNIQSTHVYHQYTLTIRPSSGINRNLLRSKLSEAGIPSMVYYPYPLHHQQAFSNAAATDAELPVTAHLCNTVISLPVHTEMNEPMISYICNTLLQAAAQSITA